MIKAALCLVVLALALPSGRLAHGSRSGLASADTAKAATSMSGPGGGGPDLPVLHPLGVRANPSTLVGGGTVSVTVSFPAAVPYDRTVNISTDNPDVFSSLPSTAVVAAYATSTTFDADTNTVSSTENASIAGVSGQSQGSTTITVTP
jgi:hypothetical protein